MAITQQTWDRALESVVNGIIAGDRAPSAVVKAMSGALYDLSLSSWEALDFAVSGGVCSDVRSVPHEIIWKRDTDAPAAAPTEGG